MEPPALPLPPLLQVERAVAPIAFPDPALEQVLRHHLFPAGSKPEVCQRLGAVRYAYNRVDLDGDRQPETLVALLGPQTCGPQGCPVLLLKEFGRRITPMQTIWGFRSSLVVSDSRSQGWRDLLFAEPRSPEGGPPRRLSHDGSGYVNRPEDSTRQGWSQPMAGMAALVIKPSPYLVQGHQLSCPLRGKP